MKPTPQFVHMITSLFVHRKQKITREDLTKHNSQDVSFYSISKGTFKKDTLISRTEAFSDQVMIEVEKGASRFIVGTPSSAEIYKRISTIEYAEYLGQGYLHWQATDEIGEHYVIAKIMAQDKTPQFKIVTVSTGLQVIHNVCELPNQLY